MKKAYILFFITILLVLSVKNVYSVSVGVSPGVIAFDNMVKGGYAEKTVTITVATNNLVLVSASTRGEINDWINLSSKSFNVSISNPYELKVTIEPPVDIPNGDYKGYIRIMTEGLGDINSGEMGNVVKAAVDIVVNIKIIDAQIIQCRAFNFNVDSAEKGEPITFRAQIANDGNVRLYPHISIDIWDQQQENIVKFVEFNEDMVLPTTTGNINFKIPSDDLEIGQYWAEISADECYAQDLLTFDVLEPGTLISNGILREILNEGNVNVNDRTEVTGVFENTGQKTVLAKFKGNIQFKNSVTELFESDEIEVKPNEISNLSIYFTPKKAGRYVISGRVFYDKKRTYELSSALNAQKVKGDYINTIIYILIIIVIVLLIYIIRKEKKKLKKSRF
jgi:hypothetical protein